MATKAEKLLAIRDDCLDKLAALAAETDHSVTFTDDGRSFDFDSYDKRLRDKIDWADERLNELGAGDMPPTEIETIGLI